MKRFIRPKQFFSPKLFVFSLVLGVCVGFSATGFAGELVKGDDVYKYTDKNAVYGGTLRIMMNQIRSMDPHIETAAQTTDFANLVYNGLLRLTQDMQGVELDLAKSDSVGRLDPFQHRGKLVAAADPEELRAAERVEAEVQTIQARGLQRLGFS